MIDEAVKSKFLEFLKSKKIAVLSTVDPEGQPMSATIFFLVDDNLNFYFMSKDTRKTHNIKTNDKVALLIGTENIPVTAQIHGKVEKVNDNDEYTSLKEQLVTILTNNNFTPPIFRMDGAEIHIYKITPTWIRWLDMRDEKNNDTFIQILP